MKALRRIFYSIFLFLFVFSPCFAYAENGEPYTAACTWISTGADTVLCISLEPEKGYYTYAPLQEYVYPTEISFGAEILINAENRGKENVQEIPCLYPLGTWKEDKALGQKIRVFEGNTRIYMLFPEQYAGQYAGTIEISLLACSKDHCQPFALQKNVSSAPHIDTESFQHKNELEKLLSAYVQNNLAKEQLVFAKYKSNAKNLKDSGEKNGIEENGNLEAFFLDILKEQAEKNSFQKQIRQENQQVEYAFSVRPFYQQLEVQSIVKAIFFGFLAGFILNFMPCVLPVIALKLHALLGVSSVEFSSEQFLARAQKSFREQMFFFALGILTWFVVLAFLFGGLGLTWGQLFQEYWLMLALCILVFVLALSLFDVFHLPIINLRASEQKNIKLDAFLSGFLATILATPCSGPLLGGVLGFVLTQSFGVIVLVFGFMGLGMALPYLIFVVNPRLAAFMPKAGNWLFVMEKILAFFLLGTAIYLFSLLPEFLHLKVLVLLFVVCVCLYVWGKGASVVLGKRQKWLAGAGLCLVVFCCFSYLFTQSLSDEKLFWQKFQPQKFEQDLGQKTLVLKFTADWCPTCKVLEQTVFTEKNMHTLAEIAKAQENHEIAFVLVDMTQFEEEKQNLLTELGSASIPFLAVFPKNNPYQPIILRDVYTFNMARQVLEQAVQE